MTGAAMTLLAVGGDPVAVIREMWALPFMVNAFRAGTLTAVLAGIVGWFMVARRQTFAGHTLSVVGFPGASGAALIGAPVWAGYFAFCVAAGLVLAAATGRSVGGQRVGSSGDGRADGADGAVIGTVQAFALALGFLFVALYSGLLGGTTSLLFGSFLGITSAQVTVLAITTILVLGLLVVFGRPLLFSTVDPAVAAARGVPVRRVHLAFLLLLALAVAAAVQVTGALLVFTLMVLPAATAQRLSVRPGAAMVISVLVALVVVWAALTVAFFSPYPFGFWISTFAFGGYVAAWAITEVWERVR